MDKIRQKLDELRMLFERLSGREKVLVLATAGGLLIFIVIIISIFINMSLANLRDRVDTKRGNYERIMALESRYKSAVQSVEKIQNMIKDNQGSRITQVIGNLAEANGISVAQLSQASGTVDKKSGIREVSYKVEVRRVGFPPLLNMLEGIEQSGDLLFVRSLNMKRQYNNPEEINATFYVSTIVPMETEG